MTDTASKILCEELYKVSGWFDTDFKHYLIDGCLSIRPNISVDDDFPGRTLALVAPAYTAGYLLRKLSENPENFMVTTSLKFCNRDDMTATMLNEWRNKWIAYTPHLMQKDYPIADTPEDALAKLSIELLKQGILKQEGNSNE